MLIWFLGLSGSGKSTLGHALLGRLKDTHANVFYLDGDIFRSMFDDDIDYSIESRLKNASRISNFCAEMDRQGIHVICSAMALFPEWRLINRERVSRYFEIYLDIPMEILEARDPKNIYAEARLGKMKDVIGIDIPFPPPEQPDLVISSGDQAKGENFCLNKILAHLPPLN